MIFLLEDLFLVLDEQADDHQSCHLQGRLPSCRVYSVECTLYSVQCRVYRCGVYVNVQSKVYSVECACYH